MRFILSLFILFISLAITYAFAVMNEPHPHRYAVAPGKIPKTINTCIVCKPSTTTNNFCTTWHVRDELSNHCFNIEVLHLKGNAHNYTCKDVKEVLCD